MKSGQDLIAENTVWGKPYKIVMEKYKKIEFPPIKVANKIITDETEKYKEILVDLPPKTEDPFKKSRY